MGTEVFVATEGTIRVISPVDGSTLASVPYAREVAIGDRPAMVERGFANSSAVVAHRVRHRGSVTIRKDSETMAIAELLRAWQEGVLVFPMSSSLRGTRYRHPHVEIEYTNADGTKETIRAYDCQVAERTHSRVDRNPSSDSFSLNALGGIDTDAEDHGEPVRSLDFHRTGSKTYIGTDGTLKTAGDGSIAIGLPYVVRRNIITASDDWTSTYASQEIATITRSLNYGTYTLPNGSQIALTQLVSTNGSKLRRTYLNLTGGGVTYRVSFYARKTAGSGSTATLSLADSATQVATFTGAMQRFEFTFSSGPSWSILSGFLDFVFADLTIEIGGLQVEAGSTTSPYQATNTSGVDLTNPVNGAGLVLEGAGTNYVYNSSAQIDTAGWSSGGSPNSVNRATTASCPTISTAIYCTYPGSGVAMLRTTPDIACAAGDVFTVSGWFYKDPGVPNARWRLFWSNNGNSGEYSPPSAGVWQWMTATFTVPAGVSSLSLQYFTDGGSAGSALFVTDLQIEKNRFATSIIRTTTGAATRSPDLCGIVSPHNYLKYARNMLGSDWAAGVTTATLSASAGPSGGAAYDITGASYRYQIIPTTTIDPSSKTVTFSIWAKGSGSFYIGLYTASNYGSGVLANPTLSSSWQRFSVTRTYESLAALNNEGIQVRIYVSSGTLTIADAMLNEGFIPGIFVLTTDTAIKKPVDGKIDPIMAQNGYIEFDAVLPALGSGSYDTYVIGGSSMRSYNALWIYSNSQIIFQKAHNGTSGALGLTPSGYSTRLSISQKNRFKVVWGNDLKDDGTRSMTLELWFNGVMIAFGDAASSNGASSWTEIDLTKFISDGTVNSTISNMVMGRRSIPAGRRAAA